MEKAMIEIPTLRPYQEELIRELRAELIKYRSVIVCMPPGAGKCLAPDTPVMLHSGQVVKAKYIRNGDFLMGPDSQPRMVSGTCAGYGEMYKVTPTKGDPYVVNDAHILTLRLNANCKGLKSGDFVDICIKDYLAAGNDFRHHLKGFRQDVDFPVIEGDLPIDPYVLGVWLGDGARHLSNGFCLSDKDRPFIEPAIAAQAASLGLMIKYREEKGACTSVVMTHGKGGKPNPFIDRMRMLGLGEKKFIPDLYRLNSRDVRLQVLAGLMDTDGSASKGGYDYITKDKKLAEHIVFVCRSVGLAAYMNLSIKGIKSNGFTGEYWRVSISGNCQIIPVKTKKMVLPRRINKDVRNVGIKVESVGFGYYCGFELTGDGRFLLGDFTVTHNTRCAKHVLGAYLNRPKKEGESGKAAFMVHRRGLVENASASFDEHPRLPHGVIMSGVDTLPGCDLQVASIDTKNSWYVEKGTYRNDFTYDFLVFDEIHSHVAKFRTFLVAHNKKRAELGLKPPFILGLSATPQHRELNKVFSKIVMGPSPSWLIENGYLSPFRYFQATQGKLNLLVKRGDDYTEDSVAAAMDGLAGDLVKDWKRLAEGRATVGFFPRRSHAYEAMEILRKNGIDAHYVDGETDDEERKSLFQRLNSGEIQYICNVGVIERGTDIPRVGCVQLCTAIGSVVRYRQMVGRGSRVHPDVPDCIVLDHAANISKHGFFDDDIAWTLEWGERPAKTHEPRATINCPNCNAIYRGGKCRQCGYEPTARERKSQGLEFTGGELREIKKSNVKTE
jgi:superfamily II DNA or RNA helicase